MTSKIEGSKNDYTWQKQSECLGLDTQLFYPEKQTSVTTATEAKKVCAICQVNVQCINQYHNEDVGIFGGLSPRQRRIWRKLPTEQQRNQYQQECLKPFRR